MSGSKSTAALAGSAGARSARSIAAFVIGLFVFAAGAHKLIVGAVSALKKGELVDRTTPLGNPHYLPPDELGDEAKRARAIAAYKRWLWEQLQKPDSPQLAELDRLAARLRAGDLTILCHCTPRSCHAQVVAKAILWRLGYGCVKN